MVVYNSTPEGLIGGGPDGGIWGWHHVRNPIHDDLNKHKPGLLSTAAGAVIGLAINTGHKLVAEEPVAGKQALLKLFYLTSYERMGMVSLSCEGGCKCTPKTVDSHTTNGARERGQSGSHGCEPERQLYAAGGGAARDAGPKRGTQV